MKGFNSTVQYKLSKYKIVDCGGRYLNNIGGEVPIGLNCSGKIEHNNNYKFATAFESDSYPGYVTEKICDIYKSNCVPIYWGHPDVVKDFNQTTFINANNFSNFDELVDYIIKVDNDEELYKSFFKEEIMSQEWLDILNDKNKTGTSTIYVRHDYFYLNIYSRHKPVNLCVNSLFNCLICSLTTLL